VATAPGPPSQCQCLRVRERTSGARWSRPVGNGGRGGHRRPRDHRRVGDSAIVGAGTYADSTLGAVSCTGEGEAIIRIVLGLRTLQYCKEADDPMPAARLGIDLLVEDGRGGGGLIVVDWRGRIGFAHSTPFMPVAWMSPALDAPRMPW
jgi:isoaspartyl peptidase/L-asparaginase-like protein (Ntn-hydrolase superfamily)